MVVSMNGRLGMAHLGARDAWWSGSILGIGDILRDCASVRGMVSPNRRVGRPVGDRLDNVLMCVMAKVATGVWPEDDGRDTDVELALSPGGVGEP